MRDPPGGRLSKKNLDLDTLLENAFKNILVISDSENDHKAVL